MDERLRVSRLASDSARYHEEETVGPLLLAPGGGDVEHEALRRVLQMFTSPRAVEHLRSTISRIVDERLDHLVDIGPPVNFHEAVAVPVPVDIMCYLLGTYDDRTFLRHLVWQAEDARELKAGRTAHHALSTYMRDALDHRLLSPTADLLGELARLEQKEESCLGGPAEEVATTILVAGTVAVTLMMDHALVILLRRPWLREFLGEEGKATEIVNEACRFTVFDPSKAGSRPSGLYRYAASSFVVADVLIETGDLVILDNFRANFDSSYFVKAQLFEPQRVENSHLTFGHGRRRCPGSSLAQRELLALFQTLFNRFAGIELLSPLDDLFAGARRYGGRLQDIQVSW